MSKYTVKGVKSFRGNEGLGFNATLCRDGKAVAHVDDSANGGEFDYHWFDYQAQKVDVSKVSYDGKPFTFKASPEEALLQEHVKGMVYPDTEVHGKPLEMGMDGFISNLVDEFENDKRLRRTCKVKTLFRVKGDKAGTYRVIKAPFDQRIKDFIVSKYGVNIEEILNEKLLVA